MTMTNSLPSEDMYDDNGVCTYCGNQLLESDYSKAFTKASGITFYESCTCEKSIDIANIKKEEQTEIFKLEQDINHLEFQINYYKKQAERLIEESKLGRRFKSRTFETFDKQKNISAYNKAFEYADTFDKNNGQGLLFIGTCGTGKTHLAAAITNHIITEFGIPVKFGSFVDLLGDIKSTWNKESEQNEDDMIRSLLEIDLLVLDDIGKEKSGEWSNSILYRVINRRYENYKATIITSNLTVKELEKEIGDATVSRIIEMCDGIKMNGEDVRKNKLK